MTVTNKVDSWRVKEQKKGGQVANGISFLLFPLWLLFFLFLRFALLLDRRRPVGLQPPSSSDSPKHQQQQKIDKNSPGYNNNSNSGGGVGSSATRPSQGSAAAAAAAAAAQHLPLGSVEAQLKYENDRLKLALAQR